VEKLGKYEIVGKVGVGGFGVVYQGYDPFIKRHVAIKTCAAEDRETRERFVREAEIAGNLQHRNIVTIFEFGFDEGIPYLVQEFLSGEDLDHKIRRGDALPLTTKVGWLVEVARGLEFAHGRGVIHRDIKPANIRILQDDTAKILDFGIARLAQQQSTLTQAGVTLGTASFLAPEQIRGEAIDFRTDLFSFGVLAYELLTYEKPFRAQEISALFYKLLNEDPAPIASRTPGVPAELERIVTRSLEKDPRRRWSSTTELLRHLERLESSGARQPQSGVLPDVEEPTRVIAADEPTRAVRGASARSEAERRFGLDELELQHLPRAGRAETLGMAPADLARAGWKRWALGLGAAAALAAALGLLFVRPGAAPLPAGPAASALPAVAESLASPPRRQPEAAPVRPPPPAAASTSEPEPASSSQSSPSAAPPTPAPAIASRPTPPPAPPPPKRGRLEVPAAWNPAMILTLDGTRYNLDHSQTIELAPGPLHLDFTLTTADYSFSRELPIRLGAGQRIPVSIPIARPGRLTVQQQIGTRPGIVRLDGEVRGRAPVRGLWLSPGDHYLEIFPLGATLEQPVVDQTVGIRSDVETIMTFDLAANPAALLRERPLAPAGGPP
jgi:hypothetical protein